MKKKLVSLFLTLLTVLPLFPTAAFAAVSTGVGITPVTDNNLWTTRLTASGQTYSYRPPTAAGRQLYCMDLGYVYIEDLESGRYYLRELENEGYVPDTERKTVYVRSGQTTLVEWENTPITGQIQITKTSEDYNSMNGWPAGTPIPNTEFEIYNYRTGNLVDTIVTDKNGVAVTKPLPLGRYKIVESRSADFYGLDKTPIEVEIEFAGQIVKAAMTNKSLYTNVSIKKTGYVEAVPGQTLRYDFSGIANNSTRRWSPSTGGTPCRPSRR